MKKLFRIIIAVVALLSVTTSVAFMTPTAEKTQKQIKLSQQQNNKQKQTVKKKQIQAKQQVVDMFASVRDDSNVLSVNDRKLLETRLKALEAKHKIRCAVVFTSNLNGMEIGKYANSLIDKYYTDGERGNIVLVVDPQKRKYYFSTDNKMRKIITDGDRHGVGCVKEAFTPALKKNKWAQAANNFAKRVEEMNDYYVKNGEPYDPANEFNVTAAIVAAIIAAIVAYAMRKYLISTMSNVAPAKTASEYLVRDSVNIQENHDTYLYTTTTVTHRSSKDSNDSTDSSHGGGGGSF